MGSAAFAVPSLQSLINSDYHINLVITQPDKPAGRGQKLTACPVAQLASKCNLPLFQPKSIKKNESIKRISESKPDLIVVVAYGKILPKAILDIPKYGCINVHSSILPKYRGAAPIQWAVVNGEVESGVATMFINEGMDEGDILLVDKTPISPDESAIELHDRLAKMGAGLLMKTIQGIQTKSIKPSSQDNLSATYAPIIKKEDGLIDWSKPATEINNLIRGMQPWPIAFTHIEEKSLRIYKATILDKKSSEKPGTIIQVDKELYISTGSNILKVEDLQIEGKKRMPADVFLRGHPLQIGTVLK